MISLERAERRAEEVFKADMSVHDGGEAVIRLQAAEGNIKVARTNP